MPTSYPSGLDNFTNPTAADNLNTPAVLHTDQHSNLNDAVEALEAKVGIDGSLVTGSFDYRVGQLEVSTHSPVTIGTANGLSLSGQAISLAAATAGNAGALSAADWTTFNNKQAALGYTPVNAASAEWIDLTDGGASVLHSHAGGGGDIIEGGAGGVAGRVAQFVTDDKHIEAAALIGPATNILTITNAAASTLALNITSAKTLTLTAVDNYTLTVPATGTAALLATANVFTVPQTINGSTNATQFTIQANATQSNTNPLIILRDSGGNQISRFHTDNYRNVFIGYDAGKSNTVSGGSNGLDNVFVGASAGEINTTGYGNVALGTLALSKNITGTENFAMGANALQNATNSYNVAVGAVAMQNITTGQYNVAIGGSAGLFNKTGTGNVYIGNSAGKGASNQSHNYNIAIGLETGYSLTTGEKNTLIGTNAGRSLTSGYENIFIGMFAGYRQTTASNLLIIDDAVRASAAVELTNAIIYGVMASTPASQTLRVNAYVGLNVTPTVAGITFADANDLIFGTATGTKIGTATGQKLSFHNSTPVIQRAGAAQDAVATTGATNVTPFGYTTAAQADAIITLVNEIRAALVEKGLIKGAA